MAPWLLRTPDGHHWHLPSHLLETLGIPKRLILPECLGVSSTPGSPAVTGSSQSQIRNLPPAVLLRLVLDSTRSTLHGPHWGALRPSAHLHAGPGRAHLSRWKAAISALCLS